MRFVVTNEQMKAAEKVCDRTTINYSEMMFNAGTACALKIEELVPDLAARIVILCGSGNNGGDGYVIAQQLCNAGYVDIIILVVNGEPKTDCAREYYDICRANENIRFVDEKDFCEAVNGCAVVVDCIFGTGFHGALPPHIAQVLSASETAKLRFAIDVPSGVNSDSGEFDERCFRPTHTLVVAAMKKGLLVPRCNDILGGISLLDIGITPECYTDQYEARLSDEEFRNPFPPRKRSSHKGTFGRLMNIAGCFCYNGAAAMSTKAALRSGVGLCMLAAPRSVIAIHAPMMNEATYLPLPETEDGFIAEGAVELIAQHIPKMNAISIGCGLGNSETTRKITQTVVRTADCPIIIDADGINSLSGNIDILKERRGTTVLTPHPLEFSRISGLSVNDIQHDRIGTAKRFAEEYGVIVVLKGANTVIAAPDGTAFVNTTGNAGLSRGGSGDTLTGIIAAMLAQGIDPLKAAVSGVYCHGLAADILLDRLPMTCILPTDIIAALPEVFRG